MKHLFNVRAQTLSQWERVAAEQAGEGLRPLISSHQTARPLLPSMIDSFISRKRRPRRRRASDVRCSANFLDHPIEPFLHFVIGESKLDESVALNKFSTRQVAHYAFLVLSAVQFNRQTKIVATEVGDETGNWHLPAEFQSVEPPPPELLPKHVFGGGALFAQTPCNLDQSFGHPMEIGRRLPTSQPLTRRLRRHPLPQGEGWRWEVKR